MKRFFRWLFMDSVVEDERLPGFEPSYYPPPPTSSYHSRTVVVPRPEWFRVEVGEDDKWVTFSFTMTKGEVAAANMEMASIGHRSSLAIMRNALQIAAKVFGK